MAASVHQGQTCWEPWLPAAKAQCVSVYTPSLSDRRLDLGANYLLVLIFLVEIYITYRCLSTLSEYPKSLGPSIQACAHIYWRWFLKRTDLLFAFRLYSTAMRSPTSHCSSITARRKSTKKLFGSSLTSQLVTSSRCKQLLTITLSPPSFIIFRRVISR